MKIVATGNEYEIKALMMALKESVSIDEYETKINEDEVEVVIDAGSHVSRTIARELLKITASRLSRIVSSGAIAEQDELLSMHDVIDRIENPPPAHRPTKRSALDQSYQVYRLKPSGSGQGEFIGIADTPDEVKILANVLNGAYVVGMIDQMPFVMPSD